MLPGKLLIILPDGEHNQGPGIRRPGDGDVFVNPGFRTRLDHAIASRRLLELCNESLLTTKQPLLNDEIWLVVGDLHVQGKYGTIIKIVAQPQLHTLVRCIGPGIASAPAWQNPSSARRVNLGEVAEPFGFC
jgi:hypothetical protein